MFNARQERGREKERLGENGRQKWIKFFNLRCCLGREMDLRAARKHRAWHKGWPPTYHSRMIESARDRMESIGETGSEAGRERKNGRYVRRVGWGGEGLHEWASQNNEESYQRRAGNPRETKKCTVAQFLLACPTLILVFAVQRCVQTCLPRCLASVIEYIKSSLLSPFRIFLLLKKKHAVVNKEQAASDIEVHWNHLQIVVTVTFWNNTQRQQKEILPMTFLLLSGVH